MEIRRDYIGGATVATVYFGGGTPSLLEPDELNAILRRLSALFPIENDVEITLEANPDDLSVRRLEAWKAAGINRLSIGVQSFFDEDLRWMNRAHDARQAIGCIGMAQSAGFGNLSVDLIYGGPTLPDRHWRENVERVIDLGVPHLSCYALTVEPRTALDTLIRRKQMAAVEPEDQARQFVLLMDWAGDAGYEHYEISNFALPGHRSRHNSSYWQGRSYLGLGPSAHSYDGRSRQWNVANNAGYVKALVGEPSGQTAGPDSYIAEIEALTMVQQMNEYIMISLRTMEGVDLERVETVFGKKEADRLLKMASEHAKRELIQIRDSRLRLSREGKLFADKIAADLFLEP